MAAAMFALLSQPAPTLATRKGLIITGLQNDFLPGGKLPVNVPPGYFDKLQHFLSSFREFGDVIWVRSEYASNSATKGGDHDRETVILGSVLEDRWNEPDEEEEERDSPIPSKRPRVSFEEAEGSRTSSEGRSPHEVTQDAADNELFLRQTSAKQACCQPGSWGAEFPSEVQHMIDSSKDLVITSGHYSAFGSTSLLMTLRMKLITELFICGGLTNISVYATAMDAGRYALPITLVDDLLVARNTCRHETAIKHLREVLEADIMTGDKVISSLRDPASLMDGDEYESVYEIEYEASASGHTHETAAYEDVLEADDKGDDEYMEDLPPPRRASSYLYDNLRGLRFTSPRGSDTCQNTSGNPVHSSALTPSESSSLLGNDQPSRTFTKTACTGEHSVSGTCGNLEKRGLKQEALTHLSEPSQQEKIDHWLNLDKKNKESRLAASPIHPALEAVASQARPDNQPLDLCGSKSAQPNNSAGFDEKPLFGIEKEAESAGSTIMYDLLPPKLAEKVFDKLKDEVTWQRMHHQTGEVPRLVCCQGSIDDDGNVPVYRHPSDQTIQAQPWTPIVDQIRRAAQEVVGHTLNHALVQWYRGGTDYISEHSDKTLDIVRNSYIVNVSFGAQRTMRLRTKRAVVVQSEAVAPTRTTYRIPMPHNSMIKMSLATNAEYLHGIHPDKRPVVELTESEKAYDGQRISLTFRNIGTFLSHDSSRIWGIGASGKSPDRACAVINGDSDQSEKLIKAFGAENQASSVRWDAIYGKGFDVLHLR